LTKRMNEADDHKKVKEEFLDVYETRWAAAAAAVAVLELMPVATQV
jgi:hypothetical protein